MGDVRVFFVSLTIFAVFARSEGMDGEEGGFDVHDLGNTNFIRGNLTRSSNQHNQPSSHHLQHRDDLLNHSASSIPKKKMAAPPTPAFLFGSNDLQCRECGNDGSIVIDAEHRSTNLCPRCAVLLILLRGGSIDQRNSLLKDILAHGLPNRFVFIDDDLFSLAHVQARTFACSRGMCQDVEAEWPHGKPVPYNSPFQWCFGCIFEAWPMARHYHLAHALSHAQTPLFLDADVGAVVRNCHERTRRLQARQVESNKRDTSFLNHSMSVVFDVHASVRFSYQFLNASCQLCSVDETLSCREHMLRNVPGDTTYDLFHKTSAQTYRVARIQRIRTHLNNKVNNIPHELVHLVCVYAFDAVHLRGNSFPCSSY